MAFYISTRKAFATMVLLFERDGDLSASSNNVGEAYIRVFNTDVKAGCHLAPHMTRGDVQYAKLRPVSRSDHNHVLAECELRVSHLVTGSLHDQVRLEPKHSTQPINGGSALLILYSGNN